MARILVTGSEGFIGKHLCKALESDLHEVIRFDLGFSIDSQIQFDGVIHLAAVSRVKDAEENPIRCLQTNILLTARLLELKTKWFMLAGSTERPVNMYGISKRFAEDYAHLRCKRLGIDLTILRFDNVVGSGNNPDKLIPTIARRITEGLPVTINEGVLPFRYIPVDDAVKTIVRLCNGVATTKEELIHVANTYP